MGLFDKFTKKTKDTPQTGIQWNNLTEEEALKDIIRGSYEKPCVIFKHSTRCSISSMALHRFERNWADTAAQIDPFYLDLITYRPISNKIAEVFDVEHQSPQVILIKEGTAIYHTSHNDISVEDLRAAL